MKKNKYFLMILLVIIAASVGTIFFTKMSTRWQIDKMRAEYSFIFPFDVTNLKYQLPEYSQICKPDFAYTCVNQTCTPAELDYFILTNKNNQSFFFCNQEKCEEQKNTGDPISGTKLHFSEEEIVLNKNIGTGKRGAYVSQSVVINNNSFIQTIYNANIMSYNDGKCSQK